MLFEEQFARQQHQENVSLKDTKSHTQDPMVVGSSVLGIKYNGGVMLASDTLASYGSMARFRSIQRMEKIGDYTAIGAGGEYSDFQHITDTLHNLIRKDFTHDDNSKLYPSEIYNYLIRTMYNRRNKFDPLYNSVLVAGFRDGKGFLGCVDLLGSHYEDSTLATGYGAHLALPLMRKHFELKNGNISESEAKKILEEGMTVLYYRDARTINKIQIATINDQGVNISDPYQLKTVWEYKNLGINK
jgi:20S proteasome subunit beta 7